MANGSGSYPFSVDVPRNTRFLFSNKTMTPAKAIAKSIVRYSLCYCLHSAAYLPTVLMTCFPCIQSLLFITCPFAKLQVFLLRPGGSTQEHFEKLVNLLEQFVYLHVDIIGLVVSVFFFFLT